MKIADNPKFREKWEELQKKIARIQGLSWMELDNETVVEYWDRTTDVMDIMMEIGAMAPDPKPLKEG